MPKDASQITLKQLFDYINARFGYRSDGDSDNLHIQSISLWDTLIYADFLPSSSSGLDIPLFATIKNALVDNYLANNDEVLDIENRPEGTKDLPEAKTVAQTEGSLDDDDDDDEDENQESELEGNDNDRELASVDEEEVQEEEQNKSYPTDAETAEADADRGDSDRRRRAHALEEIRRRLNNLPFIDLNVVCIHRQRSTAEEGEGEWDEEEDVKIPPVRVKLKKDKPLYAREILSSLFDAAEEQEQELVAEKKRRRSRGWKRQSAPLLSGKREGTFAAIRRILSMASFYAAAYLVQYLAIHFFMIYFFQDAYLRGRRAV